MTDETKKLFDAPWEADVCCEIHDKNESLICICCPGEPHIANRLARLPELYDALVEAARHCCNLCHTLSGQDEPKIEDLLKNGCPKAQYKNRAHVVSCVAMEWLDLLKKVRDGE